MTIGDATPRPVRFTTTSAMCWNICAAGGGGSRHLAC